MQQLKTKKRNHRRWRADKLQSS